MVKQATPQTPMQSLRVYLIKKEVKKYKDALRNDIPFDEHAISSRHNIKGKLFVRKPEAKPVSWAKFLETGVDERLKLNSLAHAAVLFIETKQRMFAIVFGMGRYMLRDTKYVSDFGILSALNLVDAKKVRSADTYQIDDVVINKRSQSSRNTSLGDHDLDPSRAHVRAITGISSTDGLRGTVSGNDSGFGSNARIKFKELADHCRKALAAYNAKTYKTSFPRFDDFRTMSDKVKIEQLQEKLLRKLRSNRLAGVFLSPPEPISYDDFSGFSFSPKGDITTELDIGQYVNSRKDLDDFTIEKLKADRVFLRTETSDEPLGKWSVYRSIICEIKERNKVYVLVNGAWHQVAAKFANRVRETIKGLAEVDLGLPAPQAATTEPEYMAEVESFGHGFIVLDRKLAKCEEAGHPIEICDIITKKRELIHVKRKAGGSATFSHLFLQGRNSAFALLRDQQFRNEGRAHLQKIDKKEVKRIPKATPKPSTFKVIYAVMGDFKNKSFVDSLPFFSQMSLMAVAQELHERGIAVELCKIQT